MSAIERIVERLWRQPELAHGVDGPTLTVKAPTADGFAVSLNEGTEEWFVAFDGWHERFTTEEEAVSCFAFGLSDRCRLRVHWRGSFAYRWTVEERVGDGWRDISTTGLLFFPFWRRLRIEHRQNAVILTG